MPEVKLRVRQRGLYIFTVLVGVMPVGLTILSFMADDSRRVRTRGPLEVALAWLLVTPLGLATCVVLSVLGLVAVWSHWQKMPRWITVDAKTVKLHRRNGDEAFPRSSLSTGPKGVIVRGADGKIHASLARILFAPKDYARLRQQL